MGGDTNACLLRDPVVSCIYHPHLCHCYPMYIDASRPGRYPSAPRTVLYVSALIDDDDDDDDVINREVLFWICILLVVCRLSFVVAVIHLLVVALSFPSLIFVQYSYLRASPSNHRVASLVPLPSPPLRLSCVYPLVTEESCSPSSHDKQGSESGACPNRG